MPGGDRTGPLGMGPRTGRAAGYCAGFGAPGYANPIGGRGFSRGGRGFFGGGGRGWRNWFYATGLPFWARSSGGYPLYGAAALNPENELAYLKNESEMLKNSLEEINKRIVELETKEKKK